MYLHLILRDTHRVVFCNCVTQLCLSKRDNTSLATDALIIRKVASSLEHHETLFLVRNNLRNRCAQSLKKLQESHAFAEISGRDCFS